MNATISYKEHYMNLANELVKTYPEFNFENHCYLRIALDNAVGTKWDTKIARPAYKNLTIVQRALVIDYLAHYLSDRDMLLSHNAISLAYRGKLV
ncbi:acetyltransferase [Dokdonia sinensis]|uniref:Acetyltransferase n=1 Tax=Dokdonia sinensis TaxID=2479847 RepID=A0A3M0GAJ7_9FLAO|nr:acetyltransferase [Dokdonia sinensis]RMB59502.1 acetyltransferase [Dokdonia sinensis]